MTSNTIFESEMYNKPRWTDDVIDFTSDDWDIETKDMILNCTGVQTGTSTIQEIREMSKDAQIRKTLDTNIRNQVGTGGDIGFATEVSGKSYINVVNDGRNMSNKSMLKPEISPERDKQELSVCDTGKLLITNPSNVVNETRSNKKRHWEEDAEPSCSAKRSIISNIENHNAILDIAYVDTDGNTNSLECLKETNATIDKRERIIRNNDFELCEIQSKMSKDPRLWAILDEDLMPSPRRQRFWDARCTNCRREGHLRQNCPEPRKPIRCYMCGTQGHTEIRCPQKMCLTCGKKQGTFRKTCESCRTLYCCMCKAVGHKSSDCPDLWRRFHQTTQHSQVNLPVNSNHVMKPANLLICCNCTKRGHDAFACREYRWSPHFPTPAFVTSYTDGPAYAQLHSRKTTPTTSLPEIQQNKASTSVTLQNAAKAQTAKDHDAEIILYAHGDFLKDEGFPEINAKLSKGDKYHITGLMNHQIRPLFLRELCETIPFLVKIYIKDDVVSLKLAAFKNHLQPLYKLIRHWLQMEDDDKCRAITVQLPRMRTDMLNLLESKLPEFTDIHNPEELWKEISRLKKEQANAKDPEVARSTVKIITDLQLKLVKVFHTFPKLVSPGRTLGSILKSLRKQTEEKISPLQYLDILIVYNKMFTPYTPPRMAEELARDKRQQTRKSLPINPGYRYVKTLEQMKALNIICTSSNDDQISPEKYTPTNFNTESSNIIITSAPVMYRNVNKNSEVDNTNATAISANVTRSLNPTVVNVGTCQSATEENLWNLMSTSNQNVATGTHTIMDLGTATAHSVKLNDETTNTPSVPSTSTFCSQLELDNKKIDQPITGNKSKKQRRLEHMNATGDAINGNLKRAAESVVKSARALRLPHITKPAMEVERMIKDNTVTRKHIRTLSKLIKLEKSHQKFLTQFCQDQLH